MTEPVKRYYIMESAVVPMLDKQMTYTPLVNYKTDVHVVPLVMAADHARLEQEYAELVERYGKLQTGEGHITHRVIAERDAALKLLARCQEKLDPHRDAVLWGEVCDALTTKP